MSRVRCNSSPRRRPSNTVDISKLPSYRNNFNEALKGIEGVLLNQTLKPLMSKLMDKMNELMQPENMVMHKPETIASDI